MDRERAHWGDTPFIPPEEIILIRKISEGSFGAVYKAIYMYQLCAVKIFISHNCRGSRGSMDGSGNGEEEVPLIRQMEQEVRILRNLHHDNVVGFLGAVESPPAIVMNYCRSGSLWDIIRRAQMSEKIRRKLSWTRRVNLLLGAAQGMAFIHSKIGSKPTILHRDLKSPNILMDKDWVVKIADFGLSRFLDPDFNVQWDVIANNPAWMAPEILKAGQSDGGLNFNEKTDVYPFGIIMWELLTLQRPWSSEDGSMMMVVQIFAALVMDDQRLPVPDDPTTLYGVNGRVDALNAYVKLMKECWASDPEDRPTYKEVVVALQHIKDLFMKRPPPCLDRAQTNEMLKEMLNLYKNPRGMSRIIPIADSYLEAVARGGQESGSFLISNEGQSISGIMEPPERPVEAHEDHVAVEHESVPASDKIGSIDVSPNTSPFEVGQGPPSSPPSPGQGKNGKRNQGKTNATIRSPFEKSENQKRARLDRSEDDVSPFARSEMQNKTLPPKGDSFDGPGMKNGEVSIDERINERKDES